VNTSSFPIRKWVFWPPLIILILAVVSLLLFQENTLDLLKDWNDAIINGLGSLFSVSSLLMLIICLVIFLSPFGSHKIGGANSKPLMSKGRWFAIVLNTTIATGILFWGTSEPIYHLYTPPPFAEGAAGTQAAGQTALEVMFLHWSFTPYAIYCIPALLFAISFYERSGEFGLVACFFPFTGNKRLSRWSNAIDAICLYALVAGMAASLGAGVLTISSGFKEVFGFEGSWIIELTILGLVASFILSAVSGLMKGIRWLSTINTVAFVLLAGVVFFSGPMTEIIQSAFKALGNYIITLPERNLASITHPESEWPGGWTTFYWSNWMAWAPITALFLGRLGRGQTVRWFLLINWIFPALFSIVWMSIFSGNMLNLAYFGTTDLNALLEAEGPGIMIYELLNQLRNPMIWAGFFLFTAFLSYVTAADSNTEAMGGISSVGISPESPSPPILIKVVWGLLIGTIAYLMIKLIGVDGVKLLSNLGGAPALFLLTIMSPGWILLGWKALKHR
jgi:glycine betaine transporter